MYLPYEWQLLMQMRSITSLTLVATPSRFTQSMTLGVSQSCEKAFCCRIADGAEGYRPYPALATRLRLEERADCWLLTPLPLLHICYSTISGKRSVVYKEFLWAAGATPWACEEAPHPTTGKHRWMVRRITRGNATLSLFGLTMGGQR